MSDSRTLYGLRRPLLFLKATVKKQVFIPTYTRGDGTVVPGHNAMVHVAVDHDDAKVAAGQGTHSQRQAHGKLARHDWFHGMSDAHKAAVVMKHATEIQDAASAAAVLSTFRKKLLAGQKPSPAEWKRFEAAPEEKRRAIVAEARAAGKLEQLPEHFRNLPESEKKAAPEKPTPTAKVTKEASSGQGVSAAAAPLYAVAEAKGSRNAMEALECHDSVAAMVSALKSGAVQLPAGEKAQALQFDEAKGDAFFEAFDATKKPAVTSQPAKELLEDLADQSINGHSTLKVGAHYVDPNLHSMGAPQADIDAVGAFMHAVYEKAGIAPVDVPASSPPASKPATSDEHLEAINAAKLPASNVNAKVVNMKLDAIAAALKSGDAALLTMMSYGSNNYAKKQVNLANRALELLGSAERVKPGQKGTPGFRTDAQIAAAKQAAKAQRTVDPESDSLMTAIAKLGGLKASDVSSQWGLSKNDVKGVRVGILPVFSSRGKSIERMSEALHELGYLNTEEHNELADHVEKGLGGGDHFTPQGYANKAAKDHEAHYQGLTGQDVAASGFDDLPDEAQQQIEEFLDENPEFTSEEIENFERMQQLADADDVPFEPLDFGTKGARHYDFGQADEGSDVPF